MNYKNNTATTPDTHRYGAGGAGARKKLCDLCDSFAPFAVKKIKYEN
ncbi:MAG: hypothetical protein AB7S54_13165 [Bacteroidales bacterium]